MGRRTAKRYYNLREVNIQCSIHVVVGYTWPEYQIPLSLIYQLPFEMLTIFTVQFIFLIFLRKRSNVIIFFLVQCVRNTRAYFARKLYKSMKGLGTDDATLIRVVVTRCEVDMIDIKQEFQRMYQKTLTSFIKVCNVMISLSWKCCEICTSSRNYCAKCSLQNKKP